MKKISVFIAICFLVVGLWFYTTRHNDVLIAKKTFNGSSPTPTMFSSYQPQQFLFVPYWSFTTKPINNPQNANLIYFAIEPNLEGIDTTDPGYKKIVEFQKLADPNSQKYLAVQMIDPDTNTQILKDASLQSKIITQTIDSARSNNFNGIVIDFETSSLSFQEVTDRISSFLGNFARSAHTQNLKVAIALYGDTFYRVRPYDVATLARDSDTILVMAYDFTKARSNPGPNFPLNGADIYGYDFREMTTDFSKQVPVQKLAVIFGMFGYDWTVDSSGASIDNGAALSDIDINQDFITSCKFQKCSYSVDSQSGETRVVYTDKNSQNHIVWFEDANSAAQKTQYLNSQNIKSTGYWAYSYY